MAVTIAWTRQLQLATGYWLRRHLKGDSRKIDLARSIQALVAENTALRNFSQLLVYCVSVFGPQTVPSAFPLNDSAAS
ncbi:unnamed protein product, partial [Effrenium voratum]